MALTRTLNGIPQFGGIVNVSENFVYSGDPTGAATNAQNFSLGGEFRFDGTKAPLASGTFHGLVSLIAGALTLDLTALVDAYNTQNFTTKHLLFLAALAPATNANNIQIKAGAVNSYTGLLDTLIIPPGDFRYVGPIQTPNLVAISSTVKTLDLLGTGTQGLELIMFFG